MKRPGRENYSLSYGGSSSSRFRASSMLVVSYRACTEPPDIPSLIILSTSINALSLPSNSKSCSMSLSFFYTNPTILSFHVISVCEEWRSFIHIHDIALIHEFDLSRFGSLLVREEWMSIQFFLFGDRCL